MAHPATTGLQLHALIKETGELKLSLRQIPVAEPAADEVIIRLEAAPLNPSDFSLLFGAAGMATAKASGTAEFPLVTASVPAKAMPTMQGRLNQAMPVGNSPRAQALLVKTQACQPNNRKIRAKNDA